MKKKKSKDKILDPEIIFDNKDEDQKATSTALSITDPFARYMSEIKRYPLLTKEEERELAILYKEKKDPEAAQRLVKSNLRFVVKIAIEYSKYGAKLIDLVQEGNIGLMHAVREYNPYKDVRLISYAVWWIRGYIQEYLMKQYSMVKIGTTQAQKKLFYQLEKQKAELEKAGLTPTIKQLSGKLGVSEKDVRMMNQRMSGRDVSLNQLVSDSGNTHLIDLQSDDYQESVDDQLGYLEELTLLKNKIEDLKPHLNEREQVILEERLLSDNPITLQEIGDRYNTTREAARQGEVRLISKIKKLFMDELKSPK
jgi:RNA polymerase sigma-32 factor